MAIIKATTTKTKRKEKEVCSMQNIYYNEMVFMRGSISLCVPLGGLCALFQHNLFE